MSTTSQQFEAIATAASACAAKPNDDYARLTLMRSHAYTADYYPGGRGTHATVRLAEIIDGRYYFQPEKYTSHKEIEVSGKREARAVAAAHKATPWNF